MNTPKTPTRLHNTAHDDEPLVLFESESFVAFDERMDADLARLVGQYEHLAAPAAKLYSERRARGLGF